MNLDKAYQELTAIFKPEQLLRHESMSRHTSFRIGGPVDLMIQPADSEQIKLAFDILKKYDIPFMIMGNGSNLLVRDKGIRGAVIKIAERFSQAEVRDDTIHAQAGILLSALSRLALISGLRGLEFARKNWHLDIGPVLSSIPGLLFWKSLSGWRGEIMRNPGL
jgi:UDP-N-acetylmuramate dehydrogenase